MEILPPKKFEEALADLEGLVDKLDTGKLSLEDSLQAFEDGVSLVRHLEAELTKVETRVEILTRNDGGVLENRVVQNAEDDES